MAGEVCIIKAKTSVADRRRGKEIERKRVAAYCRVSTDDEEQLNSYRSQVRYYTDLIDKNPDWMMAGVYADEAITGTQVTKREGFQKMIQACMEGDVDMVITKSISRFARNTLDTLKYVRMLKEKDIAVYFEDEKINTLSMDGELLLVVLSSVAQQEVENISNNVKKRLSMKMSRGELVGFGSALGFDYDPQTKQITVNEKEAEIVRYIFNRYIEGAGSSVIARELESLGFKSPKGSNRWADTTVLGILKNEKYVGDLLQGKTFTTDPISKRRLDNQGEVDQYYQKDHHEAIVSREVFEQAQAILNKRGASRTNARLRTDEYRSIYTRKYAFSCMIRCGFCGATLTRRTWHTNNKYHKVIWLCLSASKYGKETCPNCKAINEKALESAFVESYRLITNDRKDVLQEFLDRTEGALRSKTTIKDIERKKRDIKELKQKLDNLLDMHLEGRIEFTIYEQKKTELEGQISTEQNKLKSMQDVEDSEKDLQKRIDSMRTLLDSGHSMKEFDRQVFESIVDYVIVGGYDEQGNADPSRITFVYKTGFEDAKHGTDFKPRRMNAASEKLQSHSTEEDEKFMSQSGTGACRDGSIDVKGQGLRGEKSLIVG